MPRGHKSKLRAREKKRQAQNETKALEDAQATAANHPSQNLPTMGTEDSPLSFQGAAAAAFTDAHGDGEGNPSSPQASKSLSKDPLTKKVVLLVRFLMEKYQTREPVTKADMVNSVVKSYKNHFPKILKRASALLELAFGVDLKEVDPIRHCYAFINKLDFSVDERILHEDSMPQTGFLMMVLSVIFLKDNCASEEEVWEMLNMMGIYADKTHCIYGHPKKALTQDFVQLKYLEYRQVANSDPPRYEFLWGPRAHAEVTKMKALEFLATISDTTPSDLSPWYEEALREEEERLQARLAAKGSKQGKSRRKPCPK
ncbi:melanoma-associated antigen B18-like [Echinops telfairi]|uniref:Melanoma-associated antigen B18-like n=1 Tax=Echinops telfairi TaxID=9371 RepID=A0ABM0J3T3_ECHTE|nr:melanoma-associated antigen B18-like [Echinops telfairi]